MKMRESPWAAGAQTLLGAARKLSHQESSSHSRPFGPRASVLWTLHMGELKGSKMAVAP